MKPEYVFSNIAERTDAPKNAASSAQRAPKPKSRKNRTSKQQRYLKALGIVRPPTDFQLWCEHTKETLARDIETGQPPNERRAAYDASLNSAGRCNVTVYRGNLWRPPVEGGFGVVTAEERARWRQEYQKVRAEWQARKDAALADYPKRPDSPYFLFYCDFYARYIAEHPGASVETVAREASVEWKQKSQSDEFAHYHSESARLQKEYQQKKIAHDARMAQLVQTSAASTTAENVTKKSTETCVDVDERPRKRIRTKNWHSLHGTTIENKKESNEPES